MFSFRSCSPVTPLSLDHLPDSLADTLHPRHFFVAPPLELAWEPARVETLRWELFRGQLLEPAHTRQERTFTSWNVHVVDGGQRSSEPLLSLKWDQQRGEVHVVRGLLCQVWEGYDSGGGVFLSREARRWVRERVGTVALTDFSTWEELQDELAGRVFLAVVGVSRLPLTSIEAPLPGFVLGQLGYCFCERGPGLDQPAASVREWWARLPWAQLSWHEQGRALELAVRATPPEEAASWECLEPWLAGWQEAGHSRDGFPALLRAMVNAVSLSPWTEFVARLLHLCRGAVARGWLQDDEYLDFLAHLLRQTSRHLTAYDLITFHHRGANYPDALLLDLVLKEYLEYATRQPTAFLTPGEQQIRLRRRALRQAFFLRRLYEGHPVPDAPTSPGENRRVLPPPHIRVPEEQILHPGKRRRRLYEGDPLELSTATQPILKRSLLDLEHPAELRELGMALCIDRPFSFGKFPGEADLTPLLSYEAFSRSIAARRLRQLARWFPDLTDFWTAREEQLRQLAVRGLSVTEVAAGPPRVVSLADTLRAAEDFVLLRTTPRIAQEVLSRLGLHRQVPDRTDVLIIRGSPTPEGQPTVLILDSDFRPWRELRLRLERGYRNRGGVEWPADGVEVVSVGGAK